MGKVIQVNFRHTEPLWGMMWDSSVKHLLDGNIVQALQGFLTIREITNINADLAFNLAVCYQHCENISFRHYMRIYLKLTEDPKDHPDYVYATQALEEWK